MIDQSPTSDTGLLANITKVGSSLIVFTLPSLLVSHQKGDMGEKDRNCARTFRISSQRTKYLRAGEE